MSSNARVTLRTHVYRAHYKLQHATWHLPPRRQATRVAERIFCTIRTGTCVKFPFENYCVILCIVLFLLCLCNWEFLNDAWDTF